MHADHLRVRGRAGAAGLLGIALLVVGCGGGSAAPSVAQLGTSSTSVSGASSAGSGGSTGSASAAAGGPAVAFAACIRSHGDPTLPDSRPGKPFGSDLDASSRQFQGAQRTCVKLVPADAPPALVPHKVGPLVTFATCMRKHGVPSYPDPDSQGHFPASERQINTDTPLFQSAIIRCRPLADGEPL
jgi:hypothetical protein